MPFKKSEMYYTDYKWSAREEKDDPRVTGEPDSTLLDRNEGYEVLYFVNAYFRKNDHSGISTVQYQFIERGVRACPGNIRSQEGIEKGIRENWINDLAE